MAVAVLVAIFLAGTAGWRLIVDAIHRGVVERLAPSPGIYRGHDALRFAARRVAAVEAGTGGYFRVNSLFL